jgi:hypothetical protein
MHVKEARPDEDSSAWKKKDTAIASPAYLFEYWQLESAVAPGQLSRFQATGLSPSAPANSTSATQ